MKTYRIEMPEPVPAPVGWDNETGQPIMGRVEAPGGYLEVDVDRGQDMWMVRNGQGLEAEVSATRMERLFSYFKEIGVTIREIGAAILVAVLLTLMLPNMAHAQGCPVGSHWQRDMAGMYVSEYHQMKVDVHNCGLVVVTWRNHNGWHSADYGTVESVHSGGIIATLLHDQPYGLDGRYAVGVKPAEPGYVQIITVDSERGTTRTYRLEKYANSPSY